MHGSEDFAYILFLIVCATGFIVGLYTGCVVIITTERVVKKLKKKERENELSSITQGSPIKPLKEGRIQKGGVNESPSTPPPKDPPKSLKKENKHVN